MTSSLLKTYNRTPVAFERGKGAYLYTPEGEKYLDFGAGIAVTSLGHAHPKLVEALKDQAEKLWHTSNLYEMPAGEALAEKLCANSFAEQVFFTNSGAEAVECSIKMARKFHAEQEEPEKYRLITFEGAFHGRTLATIAAGGKAAYLDGFGPKVDGFDQVPLEDIEAVKAAIGPQTAGVLIEPIIGEGGIKVVSRQFLATLRQVCDEHGLLLIFDEVQSGIGRTGKLFAHEWAGVTPDIMAVAKGLGGGFPIGACLATQNAGKGMGFGSHGSTFGGNPLAMAVGNAVIDEVLAPGFLDQVARRGLALKQKLAQLTDEYPDVIEDVRGQGLMMGLKCKVPNTALVGELLAQKLLSVPAGENVVRIIPPLIIGEAEMNEAVGKIDQACKTLRQKQHENSQDQEVNEK